MPKFYGAQDLKTSSKLTTFYVTTGILEVSMLDSNLNRLILITLQCQLVLIELLGLSLEANYRVCYIKWHPLTFISLGSGLPIRNQVGAIFHYKPSKATCKLHRIYFNTTWRMPKIWIFKARSIIIKFLWYFWIFIWKCVYLFKSRVIEKLSKI